MPVIFPIGGGKGGVGKSFITANIGALLARAGKRAVLVDLDLGASNLHTFLGIRNPKGGIGAFLEKRNNSLDQVAMPTQTSNLLFVSSVNCSMEIANLYHAQKVKLIAAIQKMPFDIIILDLGAGTNFNTLDFFLTSNSGILVCTPEPTSIENTFRFVKAAYLRKIKQIIDTNVFHRMVKEVALKPNRPVVRSEDIIEAVLKYDPEKEMLLREQIGRFQFKIILNQCRNPIDDKLGHKIKTACDRHFYSTFEFLGKIRYDERVSSTIFSKRLFAMQHPDTPAAIDLRAIAEQLGARRNPKVELKNQI